MKQVQTMTDGD